MWNRQGQVRNFKKDKRRGDEVSLEIKVSNDGEVPESLEDLTDDEVFKELINIVVDVFSHKSEKCLLTFELPSQTEGHTTVSSNSICASDSGCWDRLTDQKPPITDILSHLKYFESLPSRKSSKHNRNLKLPIIKPSKHNHKKVLDKRLNPIVQTVLHPKQGFTDLEALFKVRHRSTSRSQWQCCLGNERLHGDEKNIGKEWDRQAEVQIPKTSSTDDFGESNRRSNLYSQFHEVIDILKMLMDTYNENSHTDSHMIEYHMGEIKTHIVAIRTCLSSGSSIRSSSAEVNEVLPSPKTHKVGSFISRTRTRRRDVTVYQIATKKSLTCGSQSQRSRKRKKRNHSRSTKAAKSKLVQPRRKGEATMSLEEILKCYQQMKREETELVKVMLSRLGLTSVERGRSLSHKDVDCQIEYETVGRSCQTSGRLNVDETTQVSEIPENNKIKGREYSVLQKHVEDSVDAHPTGENDHSTAIAEPSKPMKASVRAKRRFLAKSLDLDREMQCDRMNCGTRLTKRTIPTSLEQEKRETPNVTNEVDKNDSSQCCFVSEEIINQYSDIECLQSQDDRRIIKEEKVMTRIQNAAERLEHMQDLVEKKLGYLCKQKEFYQEIKSSLINSEVEGEESKIEDVINSEESNKDQSSGSQTEQEKVPEACNTTTMKLFPSYIQYPNVNLEESKDFRELLRSFEETSSRAPSPKFKSRKTKISKVENNSQEDQLLGGKTYICNYMMEMRGCEMNDLEENSSQLQLVSVCENSIRINDKENNELPGYMDSSHEQLEVSANEVYQEVDETNLSSVNPDTSSMHCDTDKPQLRIRKKISGIGCPRKSLCTLI